ncbi:phage terminase large subunit, partial [Candidatus Babeliales bacterium]|nr:phage terminase large subunit [Candidatus Babeliales bacterium]
DLTDSNRYPLNCRDLIIDLFPTTQAHGSYTWMPVEANKVYYKGDFNAKPKFYRAYSVNPKLYDFEGKHVYIDTAGGGKNGDLTVAAVTYFLHGYVFLAEIKKWPGGYQDSVFREIAQLCLKHDLKTIDIEKNFGFGAFSSMLQPVLEMVYKEEEKEWIPQIEDVWESAQKELRIIDTIEPILGQHRLIVHEDVIQYDIDSVVKLPLEKRESHKLFHQVERVSIVRGALIHDDSLDAVAGSVRHWTELLNVDKDKRMESKATDENVMFFESWGADLGTSVGGNCKDRLANKRN